MSGYDVVVCGGGPAGASAAWRLAIDGARVLIVDKAAFPRDKPCGDGLTPRAVDSIARLGLETRLKAFNRIDSMRVHGAGRTLDFRWPQTDSFPDHGYVVARTELDEMLLRHAQEAGADVWEECEARAPVVADKRVTGVVVRRAGADEPVAATAVVAADGASSRIARALHMTRDPKRPMGIAMRAHFPSQRPTADDDKIESYLEVRDGEMLLPGYGWIFPMGSGRINVGVGLLNTYKDWRTVNNAHLMDALLRGLPASWEVPSADELRASGQLKGWRLPMGMSVTPPWRPGAIACGDAAGMVNPFNGEGISEAVESGVMGAEVLLERIDRGGVDDLSEYVRRLDDLWGPYYRLGRTFARLIGRRHMMRLATYAGMRYPPIMEFAFKVLANLYRESGGGPGDATMRGMLRVASVLRLG